MTHVRASQCSAFICVLLALWIDWCHAAVYDSGGVRYLSQRVDICHLLEHAALVQIPGDLHARDASEIVDGHDLKCSSGGPLLNNASSSGKWQDIWVVPVC